MKRPNFIFALLLALALVPADANALTKKDIVGEWALVSGVNTNQGGTKTDVWGPDPRGMAYYGKDGKFYVLLSRSDLPKFASNNRAQGTAEENKAIVQGSLAYYGAYTVKGNTIMLHVEGSTWPAWIGTDQTREVALSKGQMALSLAGSQGGSSVTTFRRVK